MPVSRGFVRSMAIVWRGWRAARPSFARWGASLSELGPDHAGHAIIAWYLAQAVCTFQAIFEPGRIILGGGVMGTPGLVERVRDAASELGKGYFVGDPREIVMLPGLGDKAGLTGCMGAGGGDLTPYRLHAPRSSRAQSRDYSERERGSRFARTGLSTALETNGFWGILTRHPDQKFRLHHH